MDPGAVVLAMLISAGGAWFLVTVAVAAGEGAPGCLLGVFAFWGVCFMGVLAEDPAVGIAAFVGTGIGIVLGLVTLGSRRLPR